jgi:hypothetical protein
LKTFFLFVFCFSVAAAPLFAQTYGSIPLDSEVYYILEQAQARGWCKPLPGVKPYSRALVLSALNEILGFELNDKERSVVEAAKKKIALTGGGGIDWQRGTYRFETGEEENIRFSANLGFNVEAEFSDGIDVTGGDHSWGTGDWLSVFVNGDFGNNMSYLFSLHGGFLRAPRTKLGKYNTYYAGYPELDLTEPDNNYNQEIDIYSQPLSFFPYSYKKNWDGFVFGLDNVTNSGHLTWPEEASIAYGMFSELSGSALSNHLSYRLGRLDREWGAMTQGGSLILNQAAQPFFGLELTAKPFSWLNYSSMTGILEYYNADGIKESALTSQNAFSLSLIELNYKNYFHLGLGSSAVWPKRFELGYVFPLISNFLYQDNIGDFDNMALFLNLKGQYPGIANLWLSFFLDEINPEKAIFELDRAMFAYQAGTMVTIPWLPFASLTLSYTKVEPYCYTHTREFVPWYGDLPMETAYTNNGAGLGYYLQPNSDEIRLRLESRLTGFTGIHLQYQMIRHGADFGSGAVDGSSFLSELDPDGRSTNGILRKYFLQDGAYQWQHIIKAGAKHSFAGKGLPFEIYGEAGFVFSQFTNIPGAPNSGSPSSYAVINTPEYPQSSRIIFTFGFRLFP